MGEEMKDWDQEEVENWIGTISTLSDKVRQQIIAGITQYSEDNEMPVTGKDLSEAEKEDLKEMCGIDGIKAGKLLAAIEDKLEAEFDDKLNRNGGGGNRRDNDNTNDRFTLNFIGANAQSINIKHIEKTMKIKEVKSLYLIEYGDETSAHKYASAKWGANEKEKISFKYNAKPMANDKTLQDYDCTDGLLPICVVFRVKGGAEEKVQNKYEHGTEKELQYDGNDKDRFRKRKLRYRKYKNIILSKQPDCIMGYTDRDGIKRAQMPCGCSIASDTMWRYLKSTFEKDMKAVNVYCPVPKDKCKGTDGERLWDLKLVFIVSDLSRNEINRYSKVINNRKSGSKSCPQCGCVTERPPNLRIWRVRCTQCNKADWCWHCLQIWKGCGYGAICGNDGCLGEKLNLVLSQETYIDPKKSRWVKEEDKMPDMRACPKCLTLIEFTEACKHMTCLGCPHEFCFKCLQTWRDSSGTCIHKSELCTMHGIQQFK